MGPVELLIHLLNFIAPALCVGLMLPAFGRLFVAKEAAASSWWYQAAIVSIVGVAVLAGGLWFFGRDGKMATYAGFVAACAFSQWLLLRGWRK